VFSKELIVSWEPYFFAQLPFVAVDEVSEEGKLHFRENLSDCLSGQSHDNLILSTKLLSSACADAPFPRPPFAPREGASAPPLRPPRPLPLADGMPPDLLKHVKTSVNGQWSIESSL
jgi:hypothetical protein